MQLIKVIKNKLSPLLTIIFNRCLNDGIFPDALKIAKVKTNFTIASII